MINMKLFKSKKGVEMTLSMVAVIVIILVTIAIILYIIWSRGKTFTSSMSCADDDCISESQCTAEGRESSLLACTKTVDKKIVTGRCCGAKT